MAILAFQKPDKVIMLEADNHFGKFEFRPLGPVTVRRWATRCVEYYCHRLAALQYALFASTVLHTSWEPYPG